MPAPVRQLSPFPARAPFGINVLMVLAFVDAAAAVTGFLWDFVFGHGKTPAKVFPATGLERARGIEPPSKAWEAFVLPLNYARLGNRVVLV
tara:strand:- start:11252 stop:11524 length:273 start_codon:yes stop_codon:yes gene_type:complete